METSTIIHKMLAGNKITVPNYQRAYSWDTPSGAGKQATQTDVFLTDLEEYEDSGAKSPYYFGHFLFEEKEKEFHVIDGQQRLTTIIIFLSALFARLRKYRELTDTEDEYFESIIKRKTNVRFSTVDYDNCFFKDYVINQTKPKGASTETESARRIANSFDYFTKYLTKKDEKYLVKMLETICNATCTTHIVKSESEAIQMFIFQNSRGKRPSNLELVKAQFMYVVHLKGGEDTENILEDIKNKFEKIYKSISSIESKINEDDILLYSLRVHFNSLWESNSLERIKELLSKEEPILFIQEFTQVLSNSFDYLAQFFGKDEQKNFAIHSFIALKGIGVGLPFIIKAYSYGVSMADKERLCKSLESLVLRHRLIGTRAELTSRINNEFANFTLSNPDINPIVERIEELKTTENPWLAHWSNDKLRDVIQGKIQPQEAKYLLWKYEIYLEGNGKSGYTPSRFDCIVKPELEHIAPKTEPSTKKHGYDIYDEEFRNNYLDCLGNYLLLSKRHNCAIGNIPFADKMGTYTHNEQQREICRLGKENKMKWKRKLIRERQKRIVDVILATF